MEIEAKSSPRSKSDFSQKLFSMKKNILFLLPILLLLACNAPSTLLPKFEEGWQFARWTEEMSVDAGLIYQRDSSDLGSFRFLDNGTLEWTDLDSVQQDFAWSYDKETEAVSISDWIFEAPLSGSTIRQEGLDFKVLESKPKEQLWRAEHQRMVYNPFTQDSGIAVIVVQWKLER